MSLADVLWACVVGIFLGIVVVIEAIMAHYTPAIIGGIIIAIACITAICAIGRYLHKLDRHHAEEHPVRVTAR